MRVVASTSGICRRRLRNESVKVLTSTGKRDWFSGRLNDAFLGNGYRHVVGPL